MATKRTRWTAADAQAVLDELDSSGLSRAEFCRRRGLRPDRLRRWRGRLSGSRTGAGGERLVELIGVGGSSHCGLTVHCPSGHRVEVADVDLVQGLRAALQVLAELPAATGVRPC